MGCRFSANGNDSISWCEGKFVITAAWFGSYSSMCLVDGLWKEARWRRTNKEKKADCNES